MGAGGYTHDTSCIIDTAVNTVIQTGHKLMYGAILRIVPKNEFDIIRISNIVWVSDTTQNDRCYTISIHGSARSVIIDSCKFLYGEGAPNAYIGNNIYTKGKVYGLIHHCVFYHSSREVISMVGEGDDAWKLSDRLGTRDALYVEDCKFVKRYGSGHAITGVNGAKCVSRHNSITNCDLDVHGYCFNGRSQYTFESYYDTIDQTGYQFSYFIRGGTGVIHNSVITGKTFAPKFRVYRVEQQTCIGGCCLAYPCLDQVGRGCNQRIAPVFIWNVTLNGKNVTPGLHSPGSANACAEQSQADYVQKDRDYFYDSTASILDTFTNKLGYKYKPYKHPHPLVNAELLD